MSNPVLNESATRRLYDSDLDYSKTMTASGVVYKTIMLFAILLCTAYFSYTAVMQGFVDKAKIMLAVGTFGGFITALFISFRPHSKYMVPLTMIYSVFEGLAVGSITGIFAVVYGLGIVVGAVMGTLTTLFSILLLYKTGLIKCTETISSTIKAATLGLAVLYIIAYVSSFFTHAVANAVFGGGQLAFVINIAACIIAALNFILDFDLIDRLTSNQAPEKFEWYCGFALMVTIVWLYIELLRLLARFNRK